MNALAEKYDMPILYSCHPRSRKRLEQSGFKLDPRVIRHEPLGFHDYNNLQMNAFAVVSDSGTLPEESSFFTSIGKSFPAVCIRTSTERPEALDKACFILAGIEGNGLLQAVTTAVEMNENGDFGIPVPDYTEENVSTKVVKIIQSYVGVVNKWYGENRKKGNAVSEASENGGMRKKERNIADGGQNADGRKNTENKDTESVSEKNKTAEKAGKILIALLRSELSGEIPVFTEEERVFFTPQNLITLYRLADAHDLAHLAGEALLNAGITVPEKIADAFRRKLALACYRYERMNYDIGRIYAAFDAEKVDYVPLKGAVIRRYYPDPAMRTSCDVDILVREKDLKRAISVLQEKSLVTSCKKRITII